MAATGGSRMLLAAGYWVERLGKAIRAPARDALLSTTAPRRRRGLVFGVHELLDQIRVIVGSLIVYAILAYKLPLWILAVPGVLAVVVLKIAESTYRELGVKLEPGRGRVTSGVKAGFPAILAAVTLGALTPHPLVVEHVVVLYGVEESLPPLFYTIAMASDAVAAVPLEVLYDRKPKLSITVVSAFIIMSALLLLSNPTPGEAAVSALLAEVAEAAYETVLRAMTRTATGYGLLGLTYGLGYTASIIFYGKLTLLQLYSPARIPSTRMLEESN